MQVLPVSGSSAYRRYSRSKFSLRSWRPLDELFKPGELLTALVGQLAVVVLEGPADLGHGKLPVICADFF